MKITDNYVFFWGEWLSNFFPCRITYGEDIFHSSEQLFMYLKAMYFEDFNTAEEILKSKSPKEAKYLGRQVKNFIPTLWDRVKETKMAIAIKFKFHQNKDLLDKLTNELYKGKTFVEASPYDRIWGIGYDENHALQNESNWGENLLGKTITSFRDSL